MALYLGTVEHNWDAIGDLCEAQMCSLGIYEHSGRSEAHGY